MRLDEIKEKYKGAELVAIIDEHGLNLFADQQQISWPDDWPLTVTEDFVVKSGFELLIV